MINASRAYGYPDLCLVPQPSSIKSRKDIDLTVRLPKGFQFHTPIMCANMRDLCSFPVLQECMKRGALCLIDRFISKEKVLSLWSDLVATSLSSRNYVGVSVGIKPADYDTASYYYDNGVQIFCLDIAHGGMKDAATMTTYLSKFPNVLVIAGNVCERFAALQLLDAGADVIKVGVAQGSVCSTYKMTGNGMPSLSALDECYDECSYKLNLISKSHRGIIADGGIRQPGDCVKALCFSNLVMCGNLFSLTMEAHTSSGGVYRGSSMLAGSYVEGEEIETWPMGTVSELFDKLEAGIRSGMSYQNCRTIEEMHTKPHRWVEIYQ